MPTPVPSVADAISAAYHAGDFEQVVALGEKLAQMPGADEAALLWLGIAQQSTARYAPAATTFGELTRRRPDVSAYWNNLALACRHGGRLEAAEQAFATAVGLAPNDAEVHYNLGLLLIQQKRWLPAREALMKAVALAPQFIEARLQAARACHVCGDNDGQQAMLANAHAWPTQPAEQALILASMLAGQGALDDALHVLDNAQLPVDGEAAAIMRLRIDAQRVALHERSNQLEHARAMLERLPLSTLAQLPAAAIEARTEGWSAHASLAMRAGEHASAAALYAQALALELDDQHRASAAFGLAAANERLGLHDDAWQALQVAHAAQREIARSVAPELLQPDSQPLQMSGHTVGHTAYQQWKPLASPAAADSPVFVVGFPRSGTTLLEQMLDAHPAFCSMDERAFIHELIERMELAGQAYPDALADLTESEADQLRAVYFRRAAQAVPERGKRRLVDKNPLNMLCLPMIMRLFPQARIILCLRHPCDVLLSCYMQPFRSPAFMVLCSSLQRLALGYVRAFEQWQQHVDVFAPRLLEWRYENVVNRFDEHVAQLGQFLELTDASPMAHFAEHARVKQYISTPSYAQVTQSISRRSVNRWHAYREKFEPELPVLAPMIRRLGYSQDGGMA